MELIKRQLGENSEIGQEKASENTIKMPINGSITLTKEAAENLSKILDEKLNRKRAPG